MGYLGGIYLVVVFRSDQAGLPAGSRVRYLPGYCVTVAVTVTVAVGCAPPLYPPRPGAGAVVVSSGGGAAQLPSSVALKASSPPTVLVRLPRTQRPSTVLVTLPLTVMSCLSLVLPWQSTCATSRVAAGAGEAPGAASAVQVSQSTPTPWCSRALVAVRSVV